MKTVFEACAVGLDNFQPQNLENCDVSVAMKCYTDSFGKLMKGGKTCICHVGIPYSSAFKASYPQSNNVVRPLPNAPNSDSKEPRSRNGIVKIQSRARARILNKNDDGHNSITKKNNNNDLTSLPNIVDEALEDQRCPNVASTNSDVSLSNSLSNLTNVSSINAAEVPNCIPNGFSVLSNGISDLRNDLTQLPAALCDYQNHSSRLKELSKDPDLLLNLKNAEHKPPDELYKHRNILPRRINGLSKLPNGLLEHSKSLPNLPKRLSAAATEVLHYDSNVPASTAVTTCPCIASPKKYSNDILKFEPTGTEGNWVRPLGYAEKFMTYAGTHGNMTTCYALWLDSKKPVRFRDIKRTCRLVYRKLHHLRVCIRQRHGISWWKEMESERIDMEEVSTSKIVETFEELMRKKYDVVEGPLWFMRFLTSPNQEHVISDSNHNLDYKYVCIFGFHHNVSDGTTNMNFCNVFLSVLNEVMEGKEVDVCEVGRFAFPIHDALADTVSTPSYQVKLYCRRIYKILIAYCEYVKNFIDWYPLPIDIRGGTQILYDEFDEFTTQCLLKRCRMEKVTLNSAFTAAANIGMYKMIQTRDPLISDTTFSNQQAVNMRRYWPADQRKEAFGCHISMLDLTLPASREDLDNFWEYTRKIHKTLLHEFNVAKRTLKMQPMSEKLWLAIFINRVLSYFKFSSANDSHYCVTNMGDISSTFKGEGPEVNASRILRSVNCHFMPTLCQHTVQTFRGKFYYSLDYYSQKLTKDTARSYADSLLGTLKRAIYSPN